MKSFLPLLLLAGISAGFVQADWQEPYSGQSAYQVDDSNVFDEGTTVDPLYSTPAHDAYSPPARQRHPFVPDDCYMEYIGKMSLSSQSARAQVMNFYLTMPLLDPSRASWGNWHAEARLSARVTCVDTQGHDVLDVSHLYTIGLRAGVARRLGQYSQFQIGLCPQLSSDFDVMSSDNFFWGGYAAFSSCTSERFQYTVGLALIPDYYSGWVVPLFNLTWKYRPGWELRLRASRLSAINKVGDHLEWGPFFQYNAGVWTVRRRGITQQFRMTNCIAGIGGQYDFTPQTTHITLLADIGTAFYTTFRVRDKDGDHTREKYRGHPSLYLRGGLHMQF